MKSKTACATLLFVLPASASFAQTQPAPQTTIKANVDEVLLDIIVRDKKGKPITDIKPDDLTILDSGVRQKVTAFRLVEGAEAVSTEGARTSLDPLRQIRLVTLTFAD